MPGGSALHPVSNAPFHAIEIQQATKDGNGNHGDGSEKSGAWRVTGAGQCPTKPIDHTGHGIETVDPEVAFRHHRAGIIDGRSERPELDDEGNEKADAAVKCIQGGEP